MKNTSISILIIGCSLLYSCKRNPVREELPVGTPVETSPANTDYPSAFTGQTRVGSVKTETKLTTAIITDALNGAWGIVSLLDGNFLVTQKSGSMWVVDGEGTLHGPIQNVPAVYAAGQGGLLGLCLDPDFASNRMVYWAYSSSGSDGSVTTVAKGKLIEFRLDDVTVIYRATPAYNGTLHYGGRVVFDRTGHLLISVGERSDASMRVQAQSLNSALGKIIRITKEGQPAAGNPFLSQANANPEIFTYGHRNPQGLAIHPVTGDIWQSEHGPRGGDELNRLTSGSNYGWPVITYGLEYSGSKIGQGIQQSTGMEQPAYYWDPSISPSGMTFYGSNHIAEWKNNLFIGALSGRHIIRLVIENNQVVGEERLLADEGQRFRDITQGTDGALYAITDQGRLYKIDKEL